MGDSERVPLKIKEQLREFRLYRVTYSSGVKLNTHLVSLIKLNNK
jgi:hypothetical protein